MRLALADELLRKTLPLLAALLVLVTVSAPAAHYVVRIGELESQGAYIAEQVAQKLGEEAVRRPRLWHYDSAKLIEHMGAFGRERDLHEIRVLDQAKRAIASKRAPGLSRTTPRIWSRALVRTPHGNVGAVWVSMSIEHARRTSMILLLPFFVLGAALAMLLLWFPQQALRGAERRIAALIDDLEKSQDALSTLNEDLERQVSERLLELRVANDGLRERDRRLQAVTSRAVASQEAERRAIGRELHDAAGQVLTAIRINLQLLQRATRVDNPQLEELERLSAASLQLTDKVMEEVRGAVAALGPTVVDEVGFAQALRRHCIDVADRSGIEIACHINSEVDALAASVETACYRIVQEALNNVVRHSQASRANVSVHCDPSILELTIIDDGVGFQQTSGTSERHGLRSMRERAELLGGRFSIEASDGGGTRLGVSIPLATPEASDREGLAQHG